MTASVIGVTLGEPSFLVYMGLFDLKTDALTSNANQLIGATSGVFQVYTEVFDNTVGLTSSRLVLSSVFLSLAM